MKGTFPELLKKIWRRDVTWRHFLDFLDSWIGHLSLPGKWRHQKLTFWYFIWKHIERAFICPFNQVSTIKTWKIIEVSVDNYFSIQTSNFWRFFQENMMTSSFFSEIVDSFWKFMLFCMFMPKIAHIAHFMPEITGVCNFAHPPWIGVKITHPG